MALSNAERQAKFRARQKERGKTLKVGWVSPEQDKAIQAFLQGKSPALIPEGADLAKSVEQLRAELFAAHGRADIALALVEIFADARKKKQRIDSDILARILLTAAQLRGELDVILTQPKSD